MKRFLSMLLVVVLTATLAVSGTLAYLQDDDSDVNVMTLGNVKIEQLEYERVVENGAWISTGETDKYGYKPDKVQKFTQAKPLYPAVFADGIIKWDDRVADHQQSWGQVGASGSNQLFDDSVKNVQDKFVFVKNTGKSDAYVRTFIALEQGDIAADNFKNVIMTNSDKDHWSYEAVATDVVIGGNKYVVVCYTYCGPKSNPTGILAPGAVSYPSLLQVYMTPKAGNEEVKAIDGNGNGTYDILVLSQAVQANGFADATSALNEAFGEANDANVVTWFEEVKIPTVYSYEGVNYITAEDGAEVSSVGGDTVYRGVLSDGKCTAPTVTIGEGIKRLNDRALCKAPEITSVSLPNSLTYIDESVFQQSGVVEVEIPENVTYIGKQAFGACNSLEKIIIKAKNVTIGNYVARACASLKEVYIYSDSVTFESGSMYFTNKESGDASGITFYVKDQAMAENLYNAFSTSNSYGLLIKSLDGNDVFYDTLK